MGNVGTTLVFRVGLGDAQALQRFTKPYFKAEDLANLNRFTAVVKMQHRGRTLPAFSIDTLPPLTLPANAHERAERIRAYSRAAYAQPRKVVDEAIKQRFQRSIKGATQTDPKQIDISEVSFFD